MPALEAARLGDEIGHTSALAGLLIGAVAAAAIAVAVVAVVGTGGVAAVAIGAGIAAAAAGGGLGGAYIGEMIPTSPTGAILTGSFDVFIGSLSAARAGLDIAACSGMIPLFPHATPLIAQGSTNVFINQMMAARKTDKLVCGAAIAKGCTTVFVGGGTATVPGLIIESEVPGWLTTSLWVVMIAGTVIATGGAVLALGWGAAMGGLLGGLVGGFLGAEGGGYVGREIGGWFGNAELGARIGSVVGGFFGGLVGGIAGGKIGGKLFPKGGAPVTGDGGNPPADANNQGGDPLPPDPLPPPDPEPPPNPPEPPPAPDPLDDPAHLRELGTDPNTGFRQAEQDAAQRLQHADVDGHEVGRLERDPSGDSDWIDQNGETYDAVGPVRRRFFNEDQFNDSIDRHLLKQGLDHVVVDVTGLDPAQVAAVRAHIASLPPDEQARIIIIGG